MCGARIDPYGLSSRIAGGCDATENARLAEPTRPDENGRSGMAQAADEIGDERITPGHILRFERPMVRERADLHGVNNTTNWYHRDTE